MENALNWEQDDLQFFTAMIVLTVGFMAYFFISKSESWKKKFLIFFGEEKTEIYWVLFERFCGVLFFGIFPVIILHFINNSGLCQYGLNFRNSGTSIIWILILSPALIIINILNCKKPDNLAMYPQIRKKEWTIKLVIVSALTWVIYLLAYEFMFRGFFLFVSLQYLNTWPALALNISIYALVHVPKGYKEAIGALPLGIVLGIITIKTGNIMVALIVHSVLALSNEWLSLNAHPEMKII